MDIVYIVRKGDENEELRYSLRSLRNLPHSRVVLVGHKPHWVRNVVHIATRQDASKAVNVRRNFEAIVDSDEVSEAFVLMNDDFFIMRPLDHIEAVHRGPLAELAKTGSSSYYRDMARAAEVLPAGALSFDATHSPMLLAKSALRKALEHYGGTIGIRSVAGYFQGLRGVKGRNAKNPPEEAWRSMTYLSTNDKSFKHREIGRFIRSQFPEASPYEGH